MDTRIAKVSALLLLVAAGCDRQASRMANEQGMRLRYFNRTPQAREHFDVAIELDSGNAHAYANRGSLSLEMGQFQEALDDLNEAIRLDPDGALPFDTLNAKAWLRATCRDERFRDGAEAVELATRACECSGWENAMILDTLAAAYAELGDFYQAVEWQTKAVQMADPFSLPGMQERLELFRAKKPYRE